MKNLLAVDASSNNLSIAAKVGDEIRIDFNEHIKFGGSQLIICLEKQLKKESLALSDFDGFVIGSGPGSFTGLRISFSLIKGFALSLKKPVFSIPSFYSCAYQLKESEEKIAIISDARKNLIYTSCFKVSKGKIKLEAKQKLAKLEDFIKAKKSYTFVTYDSNIRDKAFGCNSEICFVSQDIYPCAKNLLLLDKEHYNKRQTVAVEKLEPLYLHPKTCQIRK